MINSIFFICKFWYINFKINIEVSDCEDENEDEDDDQLRRSSDDQSSENDSGDNFSDDFLN